MSRSRVDSVASHKSDGEEFSMKCPIILALKIFEILKRQKELIKFVALVYNLIITLLT